MRKFSSISKNNVIKSLAIGKFDGMHIAHQNIFSQLDSSGIILLIKVPLTPQSSPTLLAPNIAPYIIPYQKREFYAPKPLYYIDFERIRNLSGENFLQYLLEKLPHLEQIVVGKDFRFGKNRECGVSDIPKISHLRVNAIGEVSINGVAVHSSKIREFIQNGNIKMANEFLGRKYRIEGAVVCGQGLGAKSLYATINLSVSEYVLPKDGVYATYTIIGQNGRGDNADAVRLKSISFLGNRLSTDMSFAIETHILDEVDTAKIPLYRNLKSVEIEFIDRIRDNQKFENLSALKAQISDDIKIANRILN